MRAVSLFYRYTDGYFFLFPWVLCPNLAEFNADRRS